MFVHVPVHVIVVLVAAPILGPLMAYGAWALVHRYGLDLPPDEKFERGRAALARARSLDRESRV